MMLETESISAPVLARLKTRPRPAKVHSVFNRTVNVLGEEMTWLSLHPSGTPMHPFAVTVTLEGVEARGIHGRGMAPGPKQRCFLSGCGSSIEAGDPVTLSGHSIGFTKQKLAVDLRPAAAWDPSISGLPPARGIDYAYLLGSIEGLIRTEYVTSAFLGAVTGKPPAADDVWSIALWDEAAGIVDCIETGLTTSCCLSLVRGVRRAVGLGPGLTPSGDDYLTGLLGALRCFAPGDEMGEVLHDDLAPIVHRTSLPSSFMLRAALRGHFGEPLAGLLDALAGVSATSIAGALARLTDTGAASGEDMLAGLMTGLRARTLTGCAYATN